MKDMKTFDEIKDQGLPKEVHGNPYIQEFAQTMMNLSNRINDMEDDGWNNDIDIKNDYMPSIREFIVSVTGL